jgi:GT2 family glycosyltransferase
VFLEARDRLEAYLMRLQNIAGDRPLVMGEIGLDSLRHGEGRQAEVLDWHIRTVFANGCAGAFVFAWTDEWHRGGHDIEGWRFGLTDRDRRPKPALAAVQRALRDIPFPSQLRWPRISVIVCSRNGARTIRECFDGLRRLEYPDFEVIVVDDGSTDETPAIAHEYGFVLIKTDHCGLSAARNAGLDAATGEIVAYIDDDAYPDPHWLTYLAAAFMRTAYEGIGGPNLALPDDGPIAQSVARAPGGPIHVLLSDHEAEHIPGCNMAFRRPCLQVVGGFDPQFRTAGDDVDLCWRLQQRGWKLGFCPAALVWHHRRNSVRAYWKQQRGYGKAEALLERKWPEKYNSGGHLSWAGRVYGPGCSARLWSRERVYHGTWGGALFQSLYQPGPSLPESLPAMPEWYLVIAALAIVSGLGVLWSPLFVAIPLLAGAILVLLVHAAVAAARSPGLRLDQRAITAFLHLLQPAARLTGRLRNGLTPWRRRGIRELVVPWPRTVGLWSERWRPHDEWLYALERLLRNHRVVLRRGGEFDRWDLEARDGTLGAVRLRMAVEEHGAGRQLARFFVWPTVPRCVCVLAALLTALAAGGAAAHAWGAEFILGAAALAVGLRMCRDCAAAAAAAYRALTAGVPDAQVVAVSPSAGIRWDRTP